jgi:hypothetical protein
MAHPVYEVHLHASVCLRSTVLSPLGTGAAGKLRLHCAKYRVPTVMKSFPRPIEQKVLWLPIANRCHSLPLGRVCVLFCYELALLEQFASQG